MAKPKQNKSGNFTLMVTFNHHRRNLTLGKLKRNEAELFAANIDVLVSQRKHSARATLPPAVDLWLQTLSRRHREQLGEIGLLSKYDSSLTVGQLIEAFLQEYESRPNDEITGSSKTQFRSAMKHRIHPKFKKQFVVDLEPQREHHRPNAQPIFSAETKTLCKWLESWQREHYAKASWSRANGRLREIGAWAIRNGICDYNPFTLLQSPGEVNEDRNTHVPANIVLDAMDQCIDPDTRLIWVLGRFAGFRLNSEARTLKWSDVDFGRSRLQIFDSKKKRYREMPLFDRIRNELDRYRETVGIESRYVLSYRTLGNSDANSSNLLQESLKRTGHEKWPRFRQNLRASCENDLLNLGFDERIVSQWIGHTIAVSRKHYQLQTDADYQRAVESARKVI